MTPTVTKRTARRSLPVSGIFSVLGALAVWQLAAVLLDSTYLLAGPIDVGGHIFEHAALLGRALTATLYSAALGYLFGNLAAIALAAVALMVPLAERPIRLLALIVFCLPLVATGPILRVLYGPGIGPQVTLAALSVFYTTLVPLLTGLRAVPKVWLDLTRSYGRGRWSELAAVRAPAALPYLVAGLQIAAPAAVLGALIGEFTGAERGLGVLTLRAMRSLDTDATWAIATLSATAAIGAYLAAGALGRLLWHGPPALLHAPPPKDNRPAFAARLVTWLTIPGLLLLWPATMNVFGLNSFFAKRPADIWYFLVAAPDAVENRNVLINALGETMGTLLPGYFAGLFVGAVTAVLCVLLPGLARSVLPIAISLRAVPIVSTAPLIVLWLGRGISGTVVIVAVMIFFPTLIACLSGVQQVPQRVLDMFRSYGVGRWTLLVHARLPIALPAFFASARMAVPAAVLAATVAEWLATGKGVGNLMALAASTSDYNMLWSAIAALTTIAIAAHALVACAEAWVFRRYAPEQLQA